jgi:hypothetical protein
VTQALRQANNGKRFENIYKSTRAILFFGTPHEGMEINELKEMIRDTAPDGVSSRLGFVEQLGEGSNFLSTQREDISYLLDHISGIDILSFYETEPIKALVKVRSLISNPWNIWDIST